MKRVMIKALFGFSIFASVVVSLSFATVIWKPLSVSYPALPAKYALDVGRSGTCGALYVADPPEACSSVRNVSTFDESNKIWFALIVRGQCTFEEKILNVQKAGYRAAIVYDDRSKADLLYMMMKREEVKVHAVFTTNQGGKFLREHAEGKRGECCIMKPYNGGMWTVLAISILSIAVVVAFLILAYFTPRGSIYWQGRHERNPRTIDSQIVETLPCFAFGPASVSCCHGGETCAICLEDYVNGEVLKVLPCQHEFHSSCVGSWLTNWGTFCPVCKLDMRTQTAGPEVGERRDMLILFGDHLLRAKIACPEVAQVRQVNYIVLFGARAWGFGVGAVSRINASFDSIKRFFTRA
ncbi:hypothetical protein Patl1_29097 [Pistacia atlantica]|uniref:Uncharacterized protein n=1 Tax=Pistacia atlantica TaxID=434234 RepID=A0ACC1BEM1_9ROSI|nr:hypothetical protein Patl1_29097 [Pistacia atlantica]